MGNEKPLPETLETIADRIAALGASVDARFAQVDARFGQVDARFAQVDARFAQVDARLATIDSRFDEVTEALVEQRRYTEFAFDTLRHEMMEAMTAGFGRLDRKLDQILAIAPRPPAARRRRRS
ncbi:MAG TPA: hypothetical protein VGL62_14475 [Vicinamibacterales bacterium]|jgi:hypothetical protein